MKPDMARAAVFSTAAPANDDRPPVPVIEALILVTAAIGEYHLH